MNPEQKESVVTDLVRGLYRRQYCGYIRGKRINSVSLQAEAWFWRMHSVADDFGNAHADPSLMHADTVGRRKGVTVDQSSRLYEECTEQDLLREYEIGGEQFYHVVGFLVIQPAGRNGKRVRKVPPSPWDDDEIRLTEAQVNPKGIRVNPDVSSATHNHTHTHSHTHSHQEGGGVGEILRKVGVKGWKKCIGVTGLNRAEVLLLYEHAIAEKVREPAGWVFNAIVNDFEPAEFITVSCACRWAREGKLKSIDGQPVNGRLGNKGKFLVFGTREIPEKELSTEKIEVCI